MFPIQTRHVPVQRVMTMQRRLGAHRTDAFAREARREFAVLAGGGRVDAPFTMIFHGIVDDAGADGPLEIVQGCGEMVMPTDTVGVRTEPAHDEAFTTITKAQWAYPAILAAYDAVACSPEVAARPGSSLSCREVYVVADPDAIGDENLVCDVAFPLGDPPSPAE